MKKHKHSIYLVLLATVIVLFGLMVVLDGCSKIISEDTTDDESVVDTAEDLVGEAHSGERESNEREKPLNTRRNQETENNNPLIDDNRDEQKTTVIIPRFDEGKLRLYEKEYRDIEKTDLEPIIIDKLVKPKTNIPHERVKPEVVDKEAAESICKYEKCNLKYSCQEYFMDEEGKCFYSEGYSEVSCKFKIPGECNKKEVMELMIEFYGDVDSYFNLGSWLWFEGCDEMGSPGYPCKKKGFEKSTWPIDCDEMPEEGKNCVMEEDCECFEYLIS